MTSQPLQELDACIDGAAIPGQPELVDVGASNSVSILMHADGAIVSGQPELVDVGASAYACIDGVIVPGQPEVVDVGASVTDSSGVCTDGAISAGQTGLVDVGTSYSCGSKASPGEKGRGEEQGGDIYTQS